MVASVGLALAGVSPASAGGPTSRPAAPTAEQRRAASEAWRASRKAARVAEQQHADQEIKQLQADLAGPDDARVAAAARRVEELAAADRSSKTSRLRMLVQAKRYAEADAAAAHLIARFAGDTQTVASLQKFRVQTLLAAGKPAEALSAAKAYYDVALAQTADAINTVALCLVWAEPKEKGIARRFKRQQVAGAATRPAAEADPDLGEPILPAVRVDGGPLEAAIAAIQPDDYAKYVAKGNLLLAAGRAKEARAVFEDAYDLAEGQDVGPAVENVARAIRAESGCVGPANAYLLSLQEKKN